jgi:hypothetical protein
VCAEGPQSAVRARSCPNANALAAHGAARAAFPPLIQPTTARHSQPRTRIAQ